MTSSSLRLSLALFLCVVAASTSHAQASSQSQAGGQVLASGLVGGSAGISIPTGRLGDVYAPGFNLSGLAQFRSPNEAVGIRGEVLWEHFGRKTGVTGIDNKNSVSGIENAMYFGPGYAVRPYFIGGMGIYHVTDQGTRPGFNFGLGMDIPLSGLSAHLEARLHKVLVDQGSYVTVPLSFGVRF